MRNLPKDYEQIYFIVKGYGVWLHNSDDGDKSVETCKPAVQA